MPDVSDEYLEFMARMAATEPAATEAPAPGSFADLAIGPIVPDWVFNGDQARGIKADHRFAPFAHIELNRAEHCMFYYAGAGPEDPNWPRPKIRLLPESPSDRWDYRQLPPPPGLYWRWVNTWCRIRVRIIEALPMTFRRYVY